MKPGASREGGRRLVVALALGLLSAALSLLCAATPASASPDDEAVEGDGEPTEGLQGVVRTRDEEGERVPVEGVAFTIYDEEGNELGQATTDAEGQWSFGVPGPGIYSVELDEQSLPEGVELRNPENNPLTDIQVGPGDFRNTLFPTGERQGTSDSGQIEWVQLFVDGIKLGIIIGMCAIGLSLIYGTTGLVNFAHGEMVTFGAMVAFVINVTWVGWASFLPGALAGATDSLVFAAVMAVLVTGLAGYLFNRFVWRPLRNRGASLVSMLVVSIGFSILFRYIMLFQFGGRNGFYRDFQLQQVWDFQWFALAPKDVFIMLFSVGVLVAIGLGLQMTRAGKAMRAVADNKDLAESSGIDVEQVITWVWVAGSALAGLGGVLFGLTENINWEMGFRLLLLMFAGVTLGGLGTAYGALLGSLIVGVFVQMSTLFIPSDMRNAGALVVLVVILLVRPQGILGRPERVG